jgi:hypothetical protein
MAGDYLQHQYNHTRKVTDFFVAAATDDSTLISVKSANHRLYIQKITVGITTYSAKTWTFTDSAGTPVPIWHISIPAAAVALPSESNGMVIDFGPTGLALTLGKNLLLDVSAAGAAGAIHIEAYEKLEGAVAAATTN